MKQFIAFLLSVLLIIEAAYSQEPGFQNEALAIRYNTAGTAAKLAVDKQGRLIVGSAFNGVYAEDSAHTTADKGQFVLGVANANRNALAAEGDYTPLAVDPQGYLLISPSAGLPRSEDAIHTSGDAGIQALGVANTGLTALAANGDYTPLATNTIGAIYADINFSAQSSGGGANALLKLEDAAHGSGEAGVAVFGRRIDTAAASSGTSGDYEIFNMSALGALYTQDIGGTANGGTLVSAISAASNNSTNVKASAGQVYSVTGCNINAAVRYLKLYNKATAPTCGTDTPVLRLALPVNNCTTLQFPIGAAFSLGIGYCIVTGITDADNTSTAANEQTVQITYK